MEDVGARRPDVWETSDRRPQARHSRRSDTHRPATADVRCHGCHLERPACRRLASSAA